MTSLRLVICIAASLLFAGTALANDVGDTGMFDSRGKLLGWVMWGDSGFEIYWLSNKARDLDGYVVMSNDATFLTVQDHARRILGGAHRVRRGKWIVYAGRQGPPIGYAIRRGPKHWDAFEGREYGSHRYVGRARVGPYGPQAVAVLLVFKARELTHRDVTAQAAPTGLSTEAVYFATGERATVTNSSPRYWTVNEGRDNYGYAWVNSSPSRKLSYAHSKEEYIQGVARKRGVDRWAIWDRSPFSDEPDVRVGTVVRRGKWRWDILFQGRKIGRADGRDGLEAALALLTLVRPDPK